MPDPIDFYFDFASPYGYLASTQIDQLVEAHGRKAIWRPFLLGAVFKITGMSPNVSQPLRGDYSRRDAARFARLFKVPLLLPEGFPMAAIAASRAYYWLEPDDPARAKDFARAAFNAYFVKGIDLTTPDAVAEVASGIGIDPQACLAAMQAPEVKQRLRSATEEAVARGVFGSPFFIVDGEPFWGADRLDQVDRWLATGGW